jgi:2-amino-4-hydroxy-6-hydroxymethyldihydropteridine diphosphokinase
MRRLDRKSIGRHETGIMILIALGANLPGPAGETPLATCMAALDALAAVPELKLITASPWYRSAPISRFAQPDFCNGIVRMEGEIAPVALLTALQEIETRFGRQRGFADAPRTLDLDIIDLNGAVRAIPPVILPHPRAHLRAFVLRPILDVAPGWRHPTLRQGVASLLADLAPQAIEPWDS